jgi:integrase/recombinase XerD
MTPAEVKQFATLYDRHLTLLKLQGKAKKTREAYSRAVRRIVEHFDCCPSKLTVQELEDYFAHLVDRYSWSTVKLDRLGLMFFWKHVLQKDWQWLNIIKAPKVKTLPDILTPAEIERIINATKQLRYRVFVLTTYSMGLRLEETLSLQVGDIDGEQKQVHIRRGKGHKDRLVPLPDRTLEALRLFWNEHRHPSLIFPNYLGTMETIRRATSHMNAGGTQQAVKKVISACNIKKKSLFTRSATASPRIFSNAA